MSATKKTRKKATSRTKPAKEDPKVQAKADSPKKAQQPEENGAQKPDLVVFAFRLTAEERDLIHRAAGPAKASKFVRALTVAASKGDEQVVSEIMKAVKETVVA